MFVRGGLRADPLFGEGDFAFRFNRNPLLFKILKSPVGFEPEFVVRVELAIDVITDHEPAEARCPFAVYFCEVSTHVDVDDIAVPVD